MRLRKLSWILRRHSFLYYARFWLLSSNSTKEEVDNETYNSFNSIEDIPEIYFEVNKRIFEGVNSGTDIEKATHIARWLRSNIKGGRGLSLASDSALSAMLNGEGGVCSDLSQVYNNFCVINNILVKEWGITVIPFDKKYGGHAANEFFSKELNKWVLIDVSRCITFYTFSKDKPLSALDVFYLHDGLKYDAFLQDIDDDTQIKNYYFNPSATPFLISNYRNKIYDKYLKFFNSKIPVFFVHFFIFLIGKSYKYKFPLHDYRKMFKSGKSALS